MKKADIVFIFCIIIFFLPFFVIPSLYELYESFNKEHGMIMSFVKFAILATLGEVIGLRIKSGKYNEKGFGIIPRAIVWGILGLGIKMAFVIFASGAPTFLEYMGLGDVVAGFKEPGLSWSKVCVAFVISTTLNLIFAPVFMTLHKITDTHIINNGGTIAGFLKPIKYKEIFPTLNWDVQWNFVFKKTIPFFWIPAHTITFCLPEEWQTLFAAVLGIALGLLLSIAALKGNKK